MTVATIASSTPPSARLPHAPLGGPAPRPDGGLLARANRGETLTPVEQGQLARLLDQARSSRASEAAATPPPVHTYTSADFTLIGATEQDAVDLDQALTYLTASPTAKALLTDLPLGTKLEIVRDGGDAYSPGTKTIFWDPRSGLVTSNGTGIQSAALGLIHEIDHAVGGLRHPRPTGDDYHNTEEERVITGSETTIANDLGEPIRPDHLGGLAVMPSSIAKEVTLVADPVPSGVPN